MTPTQETGSWEATSVPFLRLAAGTGCNCLKVPEEPIQTESRHGTTFCAVFWRLSERCGHTGNRLLYLLLQNRRKPRAQRMRRAEVCGEPQQDEPVNLHLAKDPVQHFLNLLLQMFDLVGHLFPLKRGSLLTPALPVDSGA